MSLFECVPNVSEGRRPEIVARLAAAAAQHAAVLHLTSDADHHRSVLSLAGDGAALKAAVLALFAAAREHLDLSHHRGIHPRLGLVDVVPFVPLRGATRGDASALAVEVGKALAQRFEIPILFYEHAARARRRRRLADLRRGGLGKLARRLAEQPGIATAGPTTLDPTIGACCVGARGLLVAYNVVLRSADVGAARQIAAAIRERGGKPGLAGVRALGLALDGRGLAQVSMNLTDPRRTPPRIAFERVAREARTRGIEIADSEIVGLVPRAAWSDDDADRLRLNGVAAILEDQLDAAGLG